MALGKHHIYRGNVIGAKQKNRNFFVPLDIRIAKFFHFTSSVDQLGSYGNDILGKLLLEDLKQTSGKHFRARVSWHQYHKQTENTYIVS